MKGFEDLTPLTAKVTVYVPATVGVDTAADNTVYVDFVAATLSTWFGGATITPGAGCWMSEVAGLVKEETTVVYAYADPAALDQRGKDLRDMTARLAAEMQQEAVAIEINGAMYFVESQAG